MYASRCLSFLLFSNPPRFCVEGYSVEEALNEDLHPILSYPNLSSPVYVYVYLTLLDFFFFVFFFSLPPSFVS